MLYFSVFIFILILAFHFDIGGRTRNKDEWYHALLVILVLMAGFRYRFSSDTIAYTVSFYYRYPTIDDVHWDTFIYSIYEPAWALLNTLVKSFGGKWFVVQIIQAAIVNTLFFMYFKKHCAYPFLCVLLFYIIDYFYFNMTIMRNSIAMAICLFANDYFLEKNWRKAFLLYGLAFLFHFSVILLIVATPVLTRLRLNKTGLVALVSMLIVSQIFLNQFSYIIEMIDISDDLSFKLEKYDEQGINQKGNINYIIGHILIPLFYSLLALYYLKKHSRNKDLLRLEPFVMIGLSFLVMRVNLDLFFRYSMPYDAYFIMFYVESFMLMVKRHKRFGKELAYLRGYLIATPLIATYINLAVSMSFWYYPYYSIFEMKVDERRESIYREQRPYIDILDPKKDY